MFMFSTLDDVPLKNTFNGFWVESYYGALPRARVMEFQEANVDPHYNKSRVFRCYLSTFFQFQEGYESQNQC